jgi:hypothetical protein
MWLLVLLATLTFSEDALVKVLSRDLPHTGISDWNKQRMLATKQSDFPAFLLSIRDKLMYLRITNNIGELNTNIGIYIGTYKMIFHALHSLILHFLNHFEYSDYLELLNPQNFLDHLNYPAKFGTITNFLSQEFPLVSEGLNFVNNHLHISWQVNCRIRTLPPLKVKENLRNILATSETQYHIIIRLLGLNEKSFYSLGVLISKVEDFALIQDVFDYVCGGNLKSVAGDLQPVCGSISKRRQGCQHEFDGSEMQPVLIHVYKKSTIISVTHKKRIKAVLDMEIPYKNLANIRSSIHWRSDLSSIDLQFLVHLSTIV